MREFFRGWRRKVGCVTLVMACALMGLWVRSLTGINVVWFPFGTQTCVRFGSGEGRISWGKFSEPKLENLPTTIGWGRFSEIYNFHLPTPMGWNLFRGMPVDHPGWVHWSWWHCGFGMYKAENNPSCPFMVTELLVPHWSLVLPLTLLSAYLILWKPRKRKGESDA